MNSKIKSNDFFDLSGKTVIITGGSGLLGTQYAEGLSQIGANVVVADKNYSKAKILVNDLKKKYGVEHFAIKLDVVNRKSVQNMVSKVIRKY